MDDQLRALNEVEELISDFSKPRLVDQKGISDTVDADGAFVTLTVGLQVDVKMAPGQAPAHQLDTTDLDNPVAISDRHTGGFGVQDDRPVVLNLHAGGLLSRTACLVSPPFYLSLRPSGGCYAQRRPRTSSTPRLASWSARSLP
ncbi:hypothetical protein D3C81_872630 [compost metagenome]